MILLKKEKPLNATNTFKFTSLGVRVKPSMRCLVWDKSYILDENQTKVVMNTPRLVNFERWKMEETELNKIWEAIHELQMEINEIRKYIGK